MQKNFRRGEKKLLRGLKMEYFHYDAEEKQTRYGEEEENNIRNENGLIDYERLERSGTIARKIEKVKK